MIDEVRGALDEALTKVGAIVKLDDLRVVETEVLGKRGTLTQLKTRLGSVAVDERKLLGQAINDAVARVEQAVEARRSVLAHDEVNERIVAERVDLTEVTTRPTRGHAHLVTQAWDRLEDVFMGLGFQVAEGPEVETDFYNFEALNMPRSHPARSGFDTLFTDYHQVIANSDGASQSNDKRAGDSDGDCAVLLRTHTSPVQIRVMQTIEPPIYMIMPGRVFRRDTPDATHMPVFHQIEGLVIDRNITMAHLAGTIDAFTKAFFGGDFTSRLRPNYFPFTEPSAEFDIQRPDGTWIELGGCGMVHPNVLRAGGLDPEEWSGFAFGFGIDRMARERHGIDDIRDMYSNDIRFIEQF